MKKKTGAPGPGSLRWRGGGDGGGFRSSVPYEARQQRQGRGRGAGAKPTRRDSRRPRGPRASDSADACRAVRRPRLPDLTTCALRLWPFLPFLFIIPPAATPPRRLLRLRRPAPYCLPCPAAVSCSGGDSFSDFWGLSGARHVLVLDDRFLLPWLACRPDCVLRCL
jgi:hypothetical protein